MKKIAVIVAGGSGIRMGTDLPKQFLLVHNKPLLYYTLHTFLSTYDDLHVILVLPEIYLDLGREIIDAFFDKDRIKITVGGPSRFESVQNGLKLIAEDCIIFVHDAVRCLVTKDLIKRCYEEASQTGTAIPVVKSSDSVRLLTPEGNEALRREDVVMVQTPQVFHSKILLPAYDIDYKDWYTDEAIVVEAFGMKVSLVEGVPGNIKITTPLDMFIAEKMLA